MVQQHSSLAEARESLLLRLAASFGNGLPLDGLTFKQLAADGHGRRAVETAVDQLVASRRARLVQRGGVLFLQSGKAAT